ncbi:hypothetical protein P3S67_019318 [Capsicum chacoense]
MLQNPNPQPPFHFPVPSYIICCHNHGHGADMRGCSQSPVVPEGMHSYQRKFTFWKMFGLKKSPCIGMGGITLDSRLF